MLPVAELPVGCRQRLDDGALLLHLTQSISPRYLPGTCQSHLSTDWTPTCSSPGLSTITSNTAWESNSLPCKCLDRHTDRHSGSEIFQDDINNSLSLCPAPCSVISSHLVSVTPSNELVKTICLRISTD